MFADWMKSPNVISCLKRNCVFRIYIKKVSLILGNVYLIKHFLPFIYPAFLKTIPLLLNEIFLEEFWWGQSPLNSFKHLVGNAHFVELQKRKNLCHFLSLEEVLIRVRQEIFIVNPLIFGL